MLASTLLVSNLYRFARNEAWVSVLIGYAASLLIIGITVSLTRRYPGMGLFEIHEAVYGRIVGKAVSVLYVFFFVSLAIFNTRELGEFTTAFVLRQTPVMIVFVVFIAVCAWAVRKGPVNLTRYGFLMTAVTISAIVTFTLLLADKYQPRNLLPAFALPAGKYLIGAHIVTMIPIGNIVVFSTFIPHMRRPRDFGRAMLKGMTIGAAALLVIVLRDTVVLGKFITIFTRPTYFSIRYINIGDVLTRVEIVYATILIGVLFFKVSVLYYAGVSGLSQTFGLKSYQSFVYIVGALICLYAMASFGSVAENVRWKMTAAPMFSTLYIIVLPLLTLLVSMIRKGVSPKADLSKMQ